MARFQSTNVSEADVPAPPERIWEVLSSPETLARLTPLIERISADGDRWIWQMRSIAALGVHVEPCFTEQMTFEDGRRIVFDHRPSAGRSERAGATGTYTLTGLPQGGTHLHVDITIHVELPLPAVSRRAVEKVMSSLMARTGEAFAVNLYAELGIAGAPAPVQTR